MARSRLQGMSGDLSWRIGEFWLKKHGEMGSQHIDEELGGAVRLGRGL